MKIWTTDNTYFICTNCGKNNDYMPCPSCNGGDYKRRRIVKYYYISSTNTRQKHCFYSKTVVRPPLLEGHRAYKDLCIDFHNYRAEQRLAAKQELGALFEEYTLICRMLLRTMRAMHPKKIDTSEDIGELLKECRDKK